MRFVVIGNPENRRVAFFQGALAGAGLPPAAVVPWASLLSGRGGLDGALAGGAMVRIESPGEDAEVERRLIARGASCPDAEVGAPRIEAREALALPPDHGAIRYPRQAFLGFRSALAEIAGAAARAGAVLMNGADDVAAMCDKEACQSRLGAAGVAHTPPLGAAASLDGLLALLEAHRCRRAFVKLRNGSSASGVVAYETDGRRHLATTTVEVAGSAAARRLYNARSVRRYQGWEDVRAVLEPLCREGVWAERWVPKASMDGRSFDLRVVVIAGRARHVVVRTSRTPITNLHLGNRRGSVEEVRARLGEARWSTALATCEGAARAFPSSHYAGIDLLVTSDLARSLVVEVNAFGDLLPRVLDSDAGLDTYGAELSAWRRPRPAARWAETPA